MQRRSQFNLLTGLTLGLVLALVSGCARKSDVQHQTGELEKAFQSSQTNPYVRLAVSAVRTNDYAIGAIALQNAQRLPGLNAAQLMAVQRTMEALTANLVDRAAKGDANAQAALAAIERSRSQ